MDTTTPRPEPTRQTWAPPLPDAPGFDHSIVKTSGLRTHIAEIGQGGTGRTPSRFPAALVGMAESCAATRSPGLSSDLPRLA